MDLDAYLLDSRYYKALEKIANVLHNDSLDDFMCVDQIVGILEESGFDCGGRHDFG